MPPKLQRIQVTNFQSIERADIELGGLTVLVGPGRAGKSAIIRATQCALLNQTGDDFIRHGEQECLVQLCFDDGMVVAWKKARGKSAEYIFGPDGERPVTFSKTGREVPEEIRDYLGIGELEIEQGLTVTPQIKDQFASVFLLSESGSRQARILGKVTKLDAVVTAQMECKKQGDRHKRDASYAEQQLEELRAKRAELPDVEALQKELADIREKLDLVHEAFKLVDKLRALTAQRDAVGRVLAVDLEGIGGRLNKAQLAIEPLQKLQELSGVFVKAGGRADAAAVESKMAQTDLEELRQDYDKACREAEVCDTCPFR